jgi:putative ABC transport system permease protein
MTRLTEWLRTAVDEVLAHKLRSALTLIGVALGVLALMVVLSLRVGVAAAIRSDFDALGYDAVLRVSTHPVTARDEAAKRHYSRGLRREDADLLRANRRLIAAVAPVTFTTHQVGSTAAIQKQTSVFAVTGDYVLVRGRSLASGRAISDADDRHRAEVCVVGYDLARRLFPGSSPLGESITVGGHRFVVVGVGAPLSSIFIDTEMKTQEMNGVQIPLSTHTLLFGHSTLNFTLLVKATDPNRTSDAERYALRRLLFAHGGIHDFTVTNVGGEILREKSEVMKLLRNWTIVFITIAGVSLVLGGVGIFSVLQIAVSERLYEIGLRKSVGAEDRDIFGQFLIESLTLAAFGAGAGSLLALAVIQSTARYYPAGLSVSFAGLLVSNAFALITGVLAGVYPAAKAAGLEPVDALRSV